MVSTKRILLASLYTPPKKGGVENSLLFIAHSLKKIGCDVEILGTTVSSYEETVVEGIKICRVPINKFFYKLLGVNSFIISYLLKKQLDRYLEVNNFDEVWSRNFIVTKSCLESSFSGRLRTIWPTLSKMHVLGGYQNQVKGYKYLFKQLDYWSQFFIERQISRNLRNENVFFSYTLKKLGEELYGSNNSVVIRPGVDTNKYYPLNSRKHQSKGKYVLFVGRLAATKNLEVTVKLLKYLPDDFRVCIVGDGPEKERLVELSKTLGVYKRYELLGSKSGEELRTLYQGARATILPSKYESFGQVILESWACGVPVIGFSVKKSLNASKELINQDYLGKVFESYDSLDEVSDYVQGLKESPEFADQRIAHVKKEYTWDSFVNSMLS